MKTTTKQLAIWCIAALIAAGLGSCKKDPIDSLNKDSFENTVWKFVKQERLDKDENKWKINSEYTGIIPSDTFQFYAGKQMRVSTDFPYTFDPATKIIIWASTQYKVVELNSSRLVYEFSFMESKLRNTCQKIAPLTSSQLLGKWEITGRERNINKDNWETTGIEKGYWLKFESGGKGTNSRGDACNYTVTGNIVDIKCIYGRSFVVEITDDKLVFVHQNKNPASSYFKETFKRIEK